MQLIYDFKNVFLSIVIEAMPFLLIGSLISSVIDLFVSEEMIIAILPRNAFLQLIAASLLGIFLPVCECAIIPIAARLIKKGVPVRTALMFMLMSPIINPIAVTATYLAFRGNWLVVLYRVGFGFIAVLVICLIIGNPDHRKILSAETHRHTHEHGHSHSGECATCGCPHGKKEIGFVHAAKHALHEFLDVAVYLIIGAALASAINVFVPKDTLTGFANNIPLSIFSMQATGYLLSLCSHADAFVAAGFARDLPMYAVLAFLLNSPFLDLKNTIVLFGKFDKKFALQLCVLVLVVTFLVVYFISMAKII